MQRQRRIWVAITGLSLLAVLLAGALSAYGLRAHADAGPTPRDGETDQDVVQHYFEILNAGLNNSDPNALDALAQVYAPDATLTQTNAKNFIAVRHGADDIIEWYKAVGGPGKPLHGITFMPDIPGVNTLPGNQGPVRPGPGDVSTEYAAIDFHPAMRSLAPHVVISYEFAGPPVYSVPGYCMHVFTLKGGMLESVDWTTYFGPVK